MAAILNVKMTAEPAGKNFLKVKIDYDLRFFDTEIKLDVEFWELAAIIEEEEEFNIFDYGRYVGLWWLPEQGADDIVNWIHYGTVRPEGRKEIHRSFEGEIKSTDLKKKLLDKEKLKPFIFVNPQITPHIKVGE